MDFFHFSLVGEASDPVRKGEILVFPRTLFFRQNEIILQGKQRTALFQTYDWEKSSFSPSHVYLHRITKYVPGGAYISPLGLIGLTAEIY